jgi:hypothetical protein
MLKTPVLHETLNYYISNFLSVTFNGVFITFFFLAHVTVSVPVWIKKCCEINTLNFSVVNLNI